MPVEALTALRGLAPWLLERERCRWSGEKPVEQVPELLQVRLRSLPATDLLAEIRRQRLGTLLVADQVWLDATADPVAVSAGLKRLAQRETLAALALQHLTSRVAAMFERAGLPLLVLKGIALALQTSGSPWGRGGGDLDLLVPPAQLPAAVALLESVGFERPPGLFPKDLHGFWGRYSRWAGYELPLQRRAPTGLQLVDLHWSLAPVRQPLPGFEALWRRSQCLDLQGKALRTLGLADALLFAAAHAAKENWHTLRHLVDLERLARRLPASERQMLRRHRLVRLSCGVAHASLGGPELESLLGSAPRQQLSAALAVARRAQREPIRTRHSPGAWSLADWLGTIRQLAALSRHPFDWLRIFLVFTLLPAAFNDPVSGKDHGLWLMLNSRWRRWRQRCQASLNGSSPASVQSVAEPGP